MKKYFYTLASLFIAFAANADDHLKAMGDTSSSQKTGTVKISLKKGALQMRGWTLTGRVGVEEKAEGENRRDGRVQLSIRSPRTLWNSNPGPIKQNENNEYYTQESSGFLFHLDAEAAARIPVGKELVGPKRTVVDAQGLSIFSYQVVLYRMKTLQELDEKTAIFSRQLEKIKDPLIRAATEERGRALEKRSNFSYEEAEDMVNDIARLSLSNIEEFRRSLYNRKNFNPELNALLDEYAPYAKMIKGYPAEKDGSMQLNEDDSPFFTFDVRLGTAGVSYADREQQNMFKFMGNFSAVKISLESAVLFTDVANLAFQFEFDPLKSEWGKVSYNNLTRNFSMRSEVGLGASLTIKGVTFKERVRSGFDWGFQNTGKEKDPATGWERAGSVEVRNEMSLGFRNRARVGWEYEYEYFRGTEPVKTNIFFLEYSHF